MVRRCALISTLVLAATAVAFIAGCGGGGGGGPVEPAATVSGTIRDDAGLQTLSGARVTIGTANALTNAFGVFTVNTTAGSKTITISLAGYQNMTLTRDLSAGANSIGMRYLKPALQASRGAASGTVRYGGQGIAGAHVESGGSQATTKSDGSYAIYNLPTGERGILAIDQANSRAGSTSVTINAGTTVAGANIRLNLTPPNLPVF